MSAPQKFMFDNSFDKDHIKIDPLEELRETFERKIEETRAKSFEEGREAGKKEALQGIENETKKTFEALIAKEADLMQNYRREQTLAEAKAMELGITAGCKLAKALMKRTPEPLIESFFKEALELVREEPELTAHLHPSVSEYALDKIETWQQQTGQRGRLTFIKDESLAPSEVAITWKDGGIRRSVDELMNAINTAMTSFFNAETNDQQAHPLNQTERQS